MEEKRKTDDYPAMRLEMLGSDGKPLPTAQARLIIQMKRELYFRERPEESGSKSRFLSGGKPPL